MQGIDREDAGYVPYIPVESMGYDNSEPWPDDADGTGLSLQRITGSKFGDDPKNWFSAAPTAGRKNADAAAGDRDADGMSDAWEVANKLDPANAADAAAARCQRSVSAATPGGPAHEPSRSVGAPKRSAASPASSSLPSWPTTRFSRQCERRWSSWTVDPKGWIPGRFLSTTTNGPSGRPSTCVGTVISG